MSKPVVHFEINGKDGKKLQDFYSHLFDWQVNDMQGYGLVESGPGGIGGGIGQTEPGNPTPGVTIYVEVDDLDDYLRKVSNLGGRTVVPTTEMEMVTFALFADPEGNVIGLVKSEDQEHPH